eukprot:scaffold46374_cov66-Phaeocystis_antarctica.AAC.1
MAGHRVPRAAVLHVDVAVVLLGVRFALILFERVADLVPDLGGFLPEAEEPGRPRAPRAEAGVPLVQQEAYVQLL